MSQTDTPPAHILVVGSEAVNRRIVSSALASDGFDVSLAADGRTALDLLRQRPFDVVLLDVRTLSLDGVEMLEHLKAADRYVPAIIVAATEDVEHVVAFLELGAEDYLHPPFVPALLRARVGSSIARKRLHDLEAGRCLVVERHAGDPAGGLAAASVLAVDVGGLPQLGQRLGPAGLVTTLNGLFAAVAEAVATDGGVVTTVLGDAALCLFASGRPADQATRALRASRRLADALAAIIPPTGSLDAGIGVSAGEVVTGDIVTPDRTDYAAVGDTVSEARQLAAEARGTPQRVLAAAGVIGSAEREEQQAWGAPAVLSLHGRARTTLAFAPVHDLVPATGQRYRST